VLLGAQRAQDLLTERLLAHVLDEVAHHLDIDVSFEQRESDLTKRLFDIALCDATLALESLKDALEAVAQRIEHD